MGVKLLGKIKIHEIAKKLGLTSKEVLEVANKLNIEVKSHMSGVDDEEAKKIEDTVAKKEGQNSTSVKKDEENSKELPPVPKSKILSNMSEKSKPEKSNPPDEKPPPPFSNAA